MDNPKHTWSPDWQHELSKRLTELGYESLTELLADVPAQPYEAVANRIGDIAPIQVVAIQYHEAKQNGKVREAAQDGLVREIRDKLPDGWGVGDDAEFQAVLALSGWSSEICITGNCEHLASELQAICEALIAFSPPLGWKPSGVEDPIIKEVCDANWN